jgi:hypothetical protein
VTASIGYTMIKPEDTIPEIVGRADDALYVAKESGRNQLANYETLLAEGRSRCASSPPATSNSSENRRHPRRGRGLPGGGLGRQILQGLLALAFGGVDAALLLIGERRLQVALEGVVDARQAVGQAALGGDRPSTCSRLAPVMSITFCTKASSMRRVSACR